LKRERVYSVDKKLCVTERLNNGETRANISIVKNNKVTSYMRRRRLEPC